MVLSEKILALKNQKYWSENAPKILDAIIKVTYVSWTFRIDIVDMDSAKNSIEAGPVLGINYHLVYIEVKENLILICPNLRGQLK